MRKIYISGPMTGIDNNNVDEFHATEALLSDTGYIPISPTRLPIGLSYAEYMRLDIMLLGMCDCIYMLPGWQHSFGAKAELSFALSIKLKIIGHISQQEIDQFQLSMLPKAV